MRADKVRIKSYLAEIRRNSLIHRYWVIDDEQLIANIQAGREDFDRFVEEIEEALVSK